MNSKIQKMIDKKIRKIQAEFDEKFTTYKIKVKAIKDGEMEDGRNFCFKGEIYDAEFSFEPGNSEEDFYDVKAEDYLENERNENKHNCPHGMPADFFSEYFIVIA
jgi:hypothetical protein